MPEGKRRGRASQPKNMIPDHPIELPIEPVWNQQPDEIPHWHEIFNCHYLTLPGPRRSLNRAYLAANPDSRHKSPTDNWKLAHRVYRWEERARAFWEAESARFRDSVRESYTAMGEKIVEVAEKTLEKAGAIANSPLYHQTVVKRYEDGRPCQVVLEPANWSIRDSAVMLKNAVSTLETASKPDDIEAAIWLLTRNGYFVAENPPESIFSLGEDDGD